MANSNADNSQKVVWVYDHYASPPTDTGYSRHSENAALLNQYGWSARIIATPFSHRTHQMERPLNWQNRRLSKNEDGVEFNWVYTTPYSSNNLFRYLNMLSYLFTSQIHGPRGERPDAVIGSSPHLLAALSGWFTAKRFGVPFIFEVRDLWPDSLIQLGLSNPAIIWILRKIERFLYNQAEEIITLSSGISDGVGRFVDPEKVHLIPNGATALEAISDAERAKRRESAGWVEKYVAIWAGAHGEANHLDTIVDAARINLDRGNDSVIFAFLGDGSDKKRLQEKAKDLPNVQFLNPVPKSEVGAILQAADVGLIVHSDTVAVRGVRPTKLTEYMGAGIPVISDLQGECADLIRQANCGVTVPSMNPVLLLDAIVDASLNQDHFRSLGSMGIEFLKKTHDRGIIAREFAKMLDRVVSTQSA